jgi:hypothetical protein
MAVEIHGKQVQPELNFSKTTPELFAGTEMGEDALRVLADYRKLYGHISSSVKSELPQVLAAVSWSRRF